MLITFCIPLSPPLKLTFFFWFREVQDRRLRIILESRINMQQVEKILIQEESILLQNMHRKGNEVDSKVHLIESST